MLRYEVAHPSKLYHLAYQDFIQSTRTPPTLPILFLYPPYIRVSNWHLNFITKGALPDARFFLFLQALRLMLFVLARV